jgi:hypothetical protein
METLTLGRYDTIFNAFFPFGFGLSRLLFFGWASAKVKAEYKTALIVTGLVAFSSQPTIIGRSVKVGGMPTHLVSDHVPTEKAFNSAYRYVD